MKDGRVVNSLIDQTLPRTIGLEVELAEWGTLERWKEVSYKVVHDGSVQPSGREMVLAPASGRQLQENLYKLGVALLTHNAKVNHTCGLHVHVDARDLSWWDIRILMLLWLGIEKEMFERFVAPGRGKGRYCIPYLGCGNEHPNVFKRWPTFIPDLLNRATSINTIKSSWISLFYGGKFVSTPTGKPQPEDRGVGYKGAKVDKYSGPRYHALNIHSWLYRGTIEFRLKEGTVDGVEIRDWALLCGWIVELVNRISFEQAVSVYHGGMKALVDLTSPSPLSIKKPILPPSVRSYINERMK